jgi:hypothetical protein
MSQDQTINSFLTERAAPSDVTEEEAFDCYRRMEKPTPAAVAEHFTHLGRNLSCSKVNKWAVRGHWRARIDLSSTISVADPATVLGELAKLGSEPPKNVMQGLAHRLVSRMAIAIDQLEIRDITDFARVHDLAAELVKASSGPNPAAANAPKPAIVFAPFVKAQRD